MCFYIFVVGGVEIGFSVNGTTGVGFTATFAASASIRAISAARS